jgi:hypothetical protein
VKDSVTITLKKAFDDDERVNKLLDEILTNIDSKRKVKQSVSLIRTFNKDSDDIKPKKKKTIEHKNIDDIPEFKEYKKKKEKK